METQLSDLKCVSCKKKVTNLHGTAKFPCPRCGKYTMVRCATCRKTVAKYECPGCGFVGPN